MDRSSSHSSIRSASDAARSPWIRILKLSATAGCAVTVVTSAVGLLLAGVPGLVSTLAAAVVVMAFFAISLVVAHVVSKIRPHAILGAFMVTYVIKVIAFGFLLMIQPDDAWFSRVWAIAGAVIAFIAWQAAEMYGLSRTRFRVYDDG